MIIQASLTFCIFPDMDILIKHCFIVENTINPESAIVCQFGFNMISLRVST